MILEQQQQQHNQRRTIQYCPRFCLVVESYFHTCIVEKVKDSWHISWKLNTFKLIVKEKEL